MRIAVIVEYLHERGGTQRQALALARELRARGHQTTVYTRVFDAARCFPEIAGEVRVRALRTISGGGVPASGGSLGRMLRLQGRKVLDHVGATYLRHWRAMAKASAELVSLVAAEIREIDVLNPHDFGPAAWASADLSRRFGRPSVWQCNDPLYRWSPPPSSWGRLTRSMVLREDRRRTSALQHVTVLDTMAAAAVRDRYSVRPTVVRSGVDAARLEGLPPRAEARRAFGLPEAGKVITVLTLLTSPHRRVEDAVAAHAQLPNDTWLHLVAPFEDGIGGYAGVVSRAVRRSPARARIVWTARSLRGEEELRRVFAASDVYVFPNVNQTWGLAAIEAAAAGVPLVVSDGAGAHEVFTNGRDAWVYRGGDVDALAAALSQIVTNPGDAKRIADRAQQLVRANFGWANYADAMLAVFEQARSRTIPA